MKESLKISGTEYHFLPENYIDTEKFGRIFYVEYYLIDLFLESIEKTWEDIESIKYRKGNRTPYENTKFEIDKHIKSYKEDIEYYFTTLTIKD